MTRIRKFPRTAHIESSALQAGDHDVPTVSFAAIAGKNIVVTEKIDGANAGVWFHDDGALVLQSRGHALVGGPRERHFDAMKTWAHENHGALFAMLGRRYTLYGEWLYAKHTIFYDALPSWFIAFDVLDRERDEFLATAAWQALVDGASADVAIHRAPVLYRGPATSLADLVSLVGRSRYISDDWRQALVDEASASVHVDVERTVRDTDPAGLMEGLYIKVEDDVVTDRYKWVRPGFLQVVVDSDSHWHSRPIVKNRVRP